MKLKRITAALLAGVMCVGLLAGCGSKGDGDEKGSGDKITIRLLTRMAGTTAQVDIYNDILDEFKEKHPEVTIVDDSQGMNLHSTIFIDRYCIWNNGKYFPYPGCCQSVRIYR